MFRIILPPEVIAFAMTTAENRPKNINVSTPPVDPDADLFGALAEHAWAYAYGIPQSEVTDDGGTEGWGDGGIDFYMVEGTVDIKSSSRHPLSWVVKKGRCRADWYVFATVIIPDTVIFKGKATQLVVSGIPLQAKVGNNRLVDFSILDDIEIEDFSVSR